MKTTYTKFILLLAATTFIACNEEKAPSLHISRQRRQDRGKGRRTRYIQYPA